MQSILAAQSLILSSFTASSSSSPLVFPSSREISSSAAPPRRKSALLTRYSRYAVSLYSRLLSTAAPCVATQRILPSSVVDTTARFGGVVRVELHRKAKVQNSRPVGPSSRAQPSVVTISQAGAARSPPTAELAAAPQSGSKHAGTSTRRTTSLSPTTFACAAGPFDRFTIATHDSGVAAARRRVFARPGRRRAFARPGRLCLVPALLSTQPTTTQAAACDIRSRLRRPVGWGGLVIETIIVTQTLHWLEADQSP
jgi:hypothetical protein